MADNANRASNLEWEDCLFLMEALHGNERYFYKIQYLFIYIFIYDIADTHSKKSAACRGSHHPESILRGNH